MENLELTGFWWLPNEPNNKVFGNLNFNNQDGATLNLAGAFSPTPSLIRDSHGIILGFSTDGQKVTLYQNYQTNSQFLMPGMHTETYESSVIFCGAHFSNEESLIFDSVSVVFTYFEDWLGVSGFDDEIQCDDGKMVCHTVSYRSPEASIADVGNLQVVIDYGYDTKRSGNEQIILRQVPHLKLKFAGSLGFDDMISSALYSLQDFLAFAVDRPVFPTRLTVSSNEILQEISRDDKSSSIPVTIRVYYKIHDMPQNTKTLVPFDMFFSYQEIEDDFQEVMRNWFQFLSDLRPVINLYLAPFYNSNMYIDNEFLSMIQAAETYHRQTRGGSYLSDEDYLEIYRGLIDSLPPKSDNAFKMSLQSRLKYMNEYSLRKRLKELIKTFSNIVQLYIENEDTYIQQAIDTRNYLTHYDPKLKNLACKGTDLYYLTQQTRVILDICILNSLGFDTERMNKMLANSRRHGFLRKRYDSS